MNINLKINGEPRDADVAPRTTLADATAKDLGRFACTPTGTNDVCANVTDYEEARLDNRPDLAPLPALVIVAEERPVPPRGKRVTYLVFSPAADRAGRSHHVRRALIGRRVVV